MIAFNGYFDFIKNVILAYERMTNFCHNLLYGRLLLP